jgi:hypothetical protein
MVLALYLLILIYCTYTVQDQHYVIWWHCQDRAKHQGPTPTPSPLKYISCVLNTILAKFDKFSTKLATLKIFGKQMKATDTKMASLEAKLTVVIKENKTSRRITRPRTRSLRHEHWILQLDELVH